MYKRILFTIMMLCVGVGFANAQTSRIPYAVLDEGTLTFYYDWDMSNRQGTKFEIDKTNPEPVWKTNESVPSITKVKFDDSFSNFLPKSTASWFSELTNLTEVEDPKAELQRRMNKVGSDYMQKNALSGVFTENEAKVVFNDPDIPLPSFDVDFKRSTVLKIGGQTYAYPKSASDEEKAKALEDVHDAFVRFITDDPNAKFKTASRDVKMQANILMSFAYQGLDAMVMTGVSYAFDANISSDRFQCSGLGQRTQSYEFSKDEDGNIKFNYILGLKKIFIITHDENGRQTNNIDNDGMMEYKMDLKFSKNELERYSKIDWENIDRGPVNNAYEITRKMEKGWVKNLSEALPEDKKLQFDDFKISFNFHSDKFDA